MSELTGVERGFLQELAELYADPNRKVMSLWTMGFNQHVRGVWANQLVYNLHLLTGKISEPGNSPFSLTGQPSACGTAREVGTFAHRLPADMVVTNPEHRKHAEEIWRVPHGIIPEKPGYHAVEQDRMLKDGKLNFYWIQVNNNLQAAPNNSQRDLSGLSQSRQLHRRVGCLSDRDGAWRPICILPAAMWVEKEGAYGNAERRTHFWHQLVKAPGEARSDLWQMMEFSKRFTTDEVWPQEILDANPNYQGQDAVRRAVPQRQCRPLSASEIPAELREPRGEGVRLLRPERPVRGICRVRPRPWPRPRALRHLSRGARPALAGGRRQGDALALSRGLDPYVKPGKGVEFYGNPDGRAKIIAVPYEPPAESAGRGVRYLAGHRPRARALAFRLDDHARAGALQGVSRARAASCMRRMPARAASTRAPRCAIVRAAARSARGSKRAAATACRAAWCSCPGSTRASSSTR